MADQEKDFDLSVIKNLSNKEPIEFMNALYAEGYSEGHRQTVEGNYENIYPEDRKSFFHDNVGDFTIWYFP